MVFCKAGHDVGLRTRALAQNWHQELSDLLPKSDHGHLPGTYEVYLPERHQLNMLVEQLPIKHGLIDSMTTDSEKTPTFLPYLSSRMSTARFILPQAKDGRPPLQGDWPGQEKDQQKLTLERS
jgi:hypothetical protein